MTSSEQIAAAVAKIITVVTDFLREDADAYPPGSAEASALRGAADRLEKAYAEKFLPKGRKRD